MIFRCIAFDFPLGYLSRVDLSIVLRTVYLTISLRQSLTFFSDSTHTPPVLLPCLCSSHTPLAFVISLWSSLAPIVLVLLLHSSRNYVILTLLSHSARAPRLVCSCFLPSCSCSSHNPVVLVLILCCLMSTCFSRSSYTPLVLVLLSQYPFSCSCAILLCSYSYHYDSLTLLSWHTPLASFAIYLYFLFHLPLCARRPMHVRVCIG